jgi:iron(III) transport system ATP-binding protein
MLLPARVFVFRRMPFLCLKNISKNYGATLAVDDLALEVESGEFFGLLGASGCGKTTTLRMIAGLEMPDAGAIEFDKRDITRQPSERRGFGLVFQNYALFPHLNVFENVAFGLRAPSSTRRSGGARREFARAGQITRL